jgi:hypothetical protein
LAKLITERTGRFGKRQREKGDVTKKGKDVSMRNASPFLANDRAAERARRRQPGWESGPLMRFLPRMQPVRVQRCTLLVAVALPARFADRFSLSMTDLFEHVFELDVIDPID